MPNETTDLFAPATCVVRYALEQHALARGNDVFAVFEDEPHWTFQETLESVRSAAAGLHCTGRGARQCGGGHAAKLRVRA